MANNNFYVFDENSNNIMTLTDYSSSTTRSDGVVSGIADSMLHNRLYRQVSIMTAALGQVISDAGVDATDSDLQTLVNAIKSSFVTKSSGSAISVSSGGTGASTFTNNAVLTGNGTGALKAVATAKGAAYATSANGALIFGTLPVAEGGTGQTTLAAARNAMGLGNTTGALPVANGGTGLATASYKNAVVIGNSTTVTNAMQTVRTASGAFYSTGQDVKPSFGTLPVAQGGTGNTSVDSTPTANSTKMVTSGGIKTALDLKANIASPDFTGTPQAPNATPSSNSRQIATTSFVKSVLNRSSAVNVADTDLDRVMARGIQASTTDLTAGSSSLTNGTIYLVYEA